MNQVLQTELDPALIRRDGQTQIRIEIQPETVAFYELMIENADLRWPFKDPLVVFHDGSNFWLADGFQRDIAWQNVFTRRVTKTPPAYPVELHAGTLRDAMHYATHEANRHGQPFGAKDRRNHAKRLLLDPEWTLYSNREIGRITGLDEKSIRNIRKELVAEAEVKAAEEMTIGATVDTSEGVAPASLQAKSAAAGVTLKSPALAVDAPAVTMSAEIPHLDQQMALLDMPAVTIAPALLPAIYAPVGEYRITRLMTPLECLVIDTYELTLCRQPATLAYAWLTQDERNGPLWSLRPVCEGCARAAMG